MTDAEIEKVESREIWVDVFEAAEITGYSIQGVRAVVLRMRRQPEDQREIKMRKRTSRWELWLPDLLTYIDQPNRGPHRNKNMT
jgi:hypothetical protein